MNIRFKTMATLVVLNALWTTGGVSGTSPYDIDYTDVALDVGDGNQLFYGYNGPRNQANRTGQSWSGKLDNLGTVSSLVLNGGSIETYGPTSQMPGDVSAALYYCVYSKDTTINSGDFTQMVLSPAGSSTSGSTTYTRWQGAGAGINLLDGLAAGNYTLGIYFKAYDSVNEVYDPLQTPPTYTANFSLVTPVPEPTEVALPLFGALCIAGAVVKRSGWLSKRTV